MGVSHLQNLLDREYFGMKLGLAKITAFLGQIGHPERRYRSIHIAGTNGKGSTAIMIARILEAAGYRVGLFTSPHLQSFTERFQINGVPISEEHLEALCLAMEASDAPSTEGRLSFFECLTALAFQYFAEEKVDWAVIEVGLGGRLDATNVLQPALTILTPIDLDHEVHLGRELAAIAREKGGIIKRGIPVVSAPQRPEVETVLREIAEEKGAPLHFVSPHIERHSDGTFSFEGFPRLWLPVLGTGQVMNAGTAVTALRRLTDLPRQAILHGLASSYLPGRMEIVRRQPLVVIDGAHNPAAMTHLIETFQQNFSYKRVRCLFAAMRDKDIAGMLATLRSLSPELHLVSLPMERATPVDRLAAIAQPLGFTCYRHASCHDALAHLLQQELSADPLLVTGSFFLAGAVRGLLQ